MKTTEAIEARGKASGTKNSLGTNRLSSSGVKGGSGAAHRYSSGQPPATPQSAKALHGASHKLQSRPTKSPLRGSEAKVGPQRQLGTTQTTTSLFSEFSRFTSTKHRQKVSQASLRTISVNDGQGKPSRSGLKQTGTHSQANFAKAGGLTSGLHGMTPQARNGKLAKLGDSQDVALRSRQAKASSNMSHGLNGQPHTQCIAPKDSLKKAVAKVHID